MFNKLLGILFIARMNKWNWIEENERGLWINDLFQIWTFYCIRKSFIYLFYTWNVILI